MELPTERQWYSTRGICVTRVVCSMQRRARSWSWEPSKALRKPPAASIRLRRMTIKWQM